MSSEATQQAVVLVHGLWMNSLEMLAMRRHFLQLGYRVYGFNYPSLRRGPVLNARNLAAFIQSIEEPVVHVVAHSLGGIVALYCYDREEYLPPGRLVLMGAPVRGSDTAKWVSKLPRLAKLALGQATRGALLQAAPVWKGQRELGVLAGSKSVGMGSVLGALSGAHDGTVRVSETIIANATDSIVLPFNHTEMLFNSRALHCVAHFLQCGRFSH
ncbi:cob(I)alamin adenosyltransferase [gamma proteobacterium HTCC5015]|nr:cob(I)alamin adenosyltransferase [gamma proteobacterium HTCC5015]